MVEPSREEAREAFEARRVIELGLIRQMPPVGKDALKQLKQHLQREKAAVRGSDVGARSFLLGDFHVCLAECLGNHLLADTLRDFTARTTLIAMLYQSSHDAAQSCEDHVQIVAALEAGDNALAEKLMGEHIGTVQNALRLQPAAVEEDPLHALRTALAPVSKAPAARRAATTPIAVLAPTESPVPPATETPSTYLGALL